MKILFEMQLDTILTIGILNQEILSKYTHTHTYK